MQYLKNNAEKVREAKRRWQKGNSKIISAKRKRLYANDPMFRFAKLLRNRLGMALRNKAKRGSAIQLLGCSIDDAIKHITALFSEGMTWGNRGKWHLDHIKPMAAFNLEDPAQLAIACHYTNLKPIWARENLIKGDRDVNAAKNLTPANGGDVCVESGSHWSQKADSRVPLIEA